MDTLLKAIPENDQHCDLKRAEIRRWYQSYKGKNTTLLHQSSINSAVRIIQDDECWSGHEFNRVKFGEKLLNNLDVREFDRYQLACLLCLKKDIKDIFNKLNKNLTNWTTEKFVIDILDYSQIMRFWSHYINMEDLGILKNFQDMMKVKDLDYNNENDIWKYGFECAKQDGCMESLQFFWDKLKDQYKQKDKVLIDIAVHAGGFNMQSRYKFDIIEFCLKNLDSNEYKHLMEKDLKLHGHYKLLDILTGSHLYERAKNLIMLVGPEGISHDQYSISLIHGTEMEILSTHQESKKSAIKFLLWVWKLEGFDAHREYFLNNLSSRLRMLSELSEVGVLEPLEIILRSAKQEQIQKSFARYGSSINICYDLYLKNERELLNRIFSCIEGDKKFIDSLDDIVMRGLEEHEKESPQKLGVEYIFDLYKQGKREELLKSTENGKELLESIDKLLPHAICDMLLGEFSFPDVPTCLDDVGLVSSSRAISNKRS